MERVKGLGRAALETEEGRNAVALHSQLSDDLAAFEAATLADWCRLLAATSDQKLKQPLLKCALPVLLSGAMMMICCRAMEIFLSARVPEVLLSSKIT